MIEQTICHCTNIPTVLDTTFNKLLVACQYFSSLLSLDHAIIVRDDWRSAVVSENAHPSIRLVDFTQLNSGNKYIYKYTYICIRFRVWFLLSDSTRLSRRSSEKQENMNLTHFSTRKKTLSREYPSDDRFTTVVSSVCRDHG